MSTDVAHKSRWQTFEVVFGIPFLAAIALQLAVPLSLPRGFLTPAIIIAGAALIIVGATLVVIARREFAQHGQPTDPGLPTTKIVTTGVFSISSLSFALLAWFFRVVMYTASQWMMFNVPVQALLYSLVVGLGEMLILGVLYGLTLKPAT